MKDIVRYWMNHHLKNCNQQRNSKLVIINNFSMIWNIYHQFKSFSSANWWIFIILFFITIFVYITNTWNIYEIITLFSLSLLWNLCMILMQDSYKDKAFNTWSIFLLCANSIFTSLALYWFIVNSEYQYLLWQISFNLSWIQLLLKDVWWITIKWINFSTILPLWLIIIVTLIFHFNISIYWIIQSLWFLCVTSWLVLKDNIKRYYVLFLWTSFVVLGSVVWIFANYFSWAILWITVWYALLWMVTLIYYIKIFPQYFYKNS